jgi:GT2 family glycosyltransferase
MTGTAPYISVITLTHNKLEYTQRCLASWLDTRFDSWELVVVDNGSEDGTQAWLQQFQAQAARRGVPVQLIFNDGNIGCSTSRNQGIESARGSLLVFIDNDVALRSRNWLTCLSHRLEADPSCGIVGPKLVYPFPPHAIQCAGAAVSPSGRVQFRGRGEPRNDVRFAQAENVQCLISACFMFPRRLVERIGGLDEAFNPVEYEDIDFCYRARENGYTVLYEPAAEMYHFESVTTAGTRALPNTYLIIRHGLLFKKRWQHMFSNENGPSDQETRWRAVATHPLSDIGDLEQTHGMT